MNINEMYDGISSFWDSIYPIILFHILLYFACRFMFSSFSLKRSLTTYSKTEKFKSTKQLLEEFELWTKLPYLLLISAIIYLALFNSAFGIFHSLSLQPIKFVFSNEDIIENYESKNELIDIAKYGNDKTGETYIVNQLKEKYLEEYKIKHPEKFKSWVEWREKEFLKWVKYYNLLQFFIIILIVFIVVNYNREKFKTKMFMKFLLLILPCSILLMGILRYLTEQAVEEKLQSEIHFVKNELSIDNDQKIIWTKKECDSITEKWKNQREYRHQDSRLFWLSRYFNN
jgi:hypothetical protein